MAVKKNTTTKKEVDTNDEVLEQTEVIEEKKQSKKKEFQDNDYITCHSITPGGLTICCRSGNYYEFNEYGCECDILYRDLIELVHKHSDHIFNPRILIDDEDFVEEFKPLKNFYESLYTVDDLRDILRLPLDKMAEAVLKLPDGMKTTLRDLAGTMISEGEIDSVKVIKKLSEVFEIDFQLLSELFN